MQIGVEVTGMDLGVESSRGHLLRHSVPCTVGSQDDVPMIIKSLSWRKKRCAEFNR